MLPRFIGLSSQRSSYGCRYGSNDSGSRRHHDLQAIGSGGSRAAAATPQRTVVSSGQAIGNGGGGVALLPITPGDWLAGLCPGKLVIMHATIPTDYVHGIDTIPADVIVGRDDVRVVERGSGRVLATQQACMQSGLATLGRRRSAPLT